MFELKVDPERPHHYIIGVAMKTMVDNNPGKMFLKYGPVYFTNDDVENVSDALTLLNDKIYTGIYKMTATQIYDSVDCTGIVMSLIGLKIASQANQATLHHFSVEHELSGAEEFFEGYVDRANSYDTERRGLDDSRIRGA